MTTIAVLTDPPRPGVVLPDLAATSPLSGTEAAELYAAMARDVCRAVADSGGELLVNYRPAEDLPDGSGGGEDAEAEVRAAVDPACGEDARFEVQVGSTFDARAGNTVTHLLESEGVATAAVVEPTCPFLSRAVIDNAAMKLRRHDVVLGPTTDGRVYYAGFAEPVDFADAYATPALETLTERALEAGLEVDFLPMLPVLGTGADLVTTLPVIAARERAGRSYPAETAAYLAERGLAVVDDDGPTLSDRP